MILMMCGEGRGNEVSEEVDTPKDVAPVPRLLSDLKALEFLLEGLEPRIIQARLSKSG